MGDAEGKGRGTCLVNPGMISALPSERRGSPRPSFLTAGRGPTVGETGRGRPEPPAVQMRMSGLFWFANRFGTHCPQAKMSAAGDFFEFAAIPYPLQPVPSSRSASPAPAKLVSFISAYLRDKTTPGAPALNAARTAAFTSEGWVRFSFKAVGISISIPG
jgi:hypothetical protein